MFKVEQGRTLSKNSNVVLKGFCYVLNDKTTLFNI